MKSKFFRIALLTAIAMLALPGMAFAADAAKIDTGDTAWMIVSSALVMLMTPGLAFFYGGMVRKKNVLSTMMQSFIVIAVVSVIWVLFGYSLAFGPDKGGFIGSLDWIGFSHVGQAPNADYAATIPHQVFAMFQLMFAIITTALITGSFAERMRFPAFLAFSVIWLTVVYSPMAHMVWGVGGWLRNMGALDFAGGTVVHILSGVSGLTAAIILGKRKGHGSHPHLPHNIPFVVLGAGLLWFGWFGFNAGSALGANGLAATAFVVTNTSAAAAALSWMAVEWLHHGKPTLLGAASGAVAGLVAITPASGYVTPMASILIGLIGGGVCYFGVAILKSKLGYDDALDAFGCHGLGGTWGAIATGLFATKTINPAGGNGLFYGNPKQVVIQLVSIAVAYALAAVGTFVILKVVGVFTKLRATAEEEDLGLDVTMHGEEGYRDIVLGSVARESLGELARVKTKTIEA